MNSYSGSANIIAFRDFLRARFPEAHAAQALPETRAAVTDGSWLDALSLQQGAITEVVTPRAGAGLLVCGLLERESACRELTALVDGGDSFDPWSIDASALERLLWVRSREPSEAIRAGDLLLRDGNIPLVILDLQTHTQRAVQGLPSSTWHRLRMLAEKSGAALCVLTPVRAVMCARTRVRLEHDFESMEPLENRAALLGALPLKVERQQTRVVLPAAERAIA